MVAKKKSRKRKPLSTAEIARLFDIANDTRKRHAATLTKLVPQLNPKGEKVSGAEKDGFPTEAKRQEARRALLAEYRRQWESGRKSRQSPDRFLLQGIIAWALQVFTQPNPARALEYFLGLRQRPGKRPANVDRDLQITTDIIEQMNAGKSLDDATVALAEHYSLTAESIARIYKRHQRTMRSRVIEERAAAEMQNLEKK